MLWFTIAPSPRWSRRSCRSAATPSRCRAIPGPPGRRSRRGRSHLPPTAGAPCSWPNPTPAAPSGCRAPSRHCAGTARAFEKGGYRLLKFDGIYQGYDRDSATERKQRGDSKIWQFMVRVRIPGGRLTADQYLALDALADRYANGSLRVTTRQSIQFHGVLKPGLKAAIGDINQPLLTTLAACGDGDRTRTTG